MLIASALTKSYGPDPVLKDVSFTLSAGDRVGLVGPNGSGKSTLLRIIAGQIEPDGGSVWIDPAHTVAYLPQFPLEDLGLRARDALLRENPIASLQQRLGELERRMATQSGEGLERSLKEYAAAREAFEQLEGYAIEARMEEVVTGLRMDRDLLTSSVAALSGGTKTKLSLGRLLLSGARILLLDEPTNYLDLAALLWLERFIAQSDRTFLIVSHDRLFLDQTIGSVLELDEETHGVRVWTGNYSDYAEAKRRERERQADAYRDQQEEIRRVEEDIRRTKEQARSVERRVRSGLGADHQRRLAKKVAKKAKARERRLEKVLEDEESRVEKPRQTWGLHLADLGRGSIDDQRVVVEVSDLRAGYHGRDVLHGIDLLIRGRDRVALVGPNGSGKSTLVRCVIGAMPYMGTIRIGSSIRIGHLSQEAAELPQDDTPFDVLRARAAMREDEARSNLHRLLFSGDEVFKPVRALSYGQRAKLALAVLLQAGANFLILDEPTSHMDMPALEAIEAAVAAYRGPLLLVSHDRYFIQRVGVTRVEVMQAGYLSRAESMHEYVARISE